MAPCIHKRRPAQTEEEDNEPTDLLVKKSIKELNDDEICIDSVIYSKYLPAAHFSAAQIRRKTHLVSDRLPAVRSFHRCSLPESGSKRRASGPIGLRSRRFKCALAWSLKYLEFRPNQASDVQLLLEHWKQFRHHVLIS
jgi:hypothetical protein